MTPEQEQEARAYVSNLAKSRLTPNAAEAHLAACLAALDEARASAARERERAERAEANFKAIAGSASAAGRERDVALDRERALLAKIAMAPHADGCGERLVPSAKWAGVTASNVMRVEQTGECTCWKAGLAAEERAVLEAVVRWAVASDVPDDANVSPRDARAEELQEAADALIATRRWEG